MSAKTYKQVWTEVVALLPEGTVDPAPSSAASLFYAPCQAADPAASFFHYQQGGVLGVMSCLERAWEREKALAEQREQRSTLKRVSSKKLKEALSKIPADDYSVWFKVACALYNEYGDNGFELWLDWSQSSDKFDQASCDRQWAAITKSSYSGAPVTLVSRFRSSYAL